MAHDQNANDEEENDISDAEAMLRRIISNACGALKKGGRQEIYIEKSPGVIYKKERGRSRYPHGMKAQQSNPWT